MFVKIIPVIIVLAAFTTTCDSVNILSFTTLPLFSHFIVIDPLLRGLASRGHNITDVTYFPRATPVKNIKDIDVSYVQPLYSNNQRIEDILQKFRSLRDGTETLFSISNKNCELMLNEKHVKELITSNIKYDLVITEAFGADCFIPFAHKFKAPLVSVITSTAFPWHLFQTGIPDNPAYMPTFFTSTTKLHSLYERLVNTMYNVMANLRFHFHCYKPMQSLVMEHFGQSVPSLYDIRKNTSLILANTHYSYRNLQPAMPGYVEIAGIHLKQPKRLPTDLQDLLDQSSNGAILVSFGSLMKFSTMPEHKMQAFLTTFRKLPYKILWKVEDIIADMPSNVLARKWLPIQDILAHPNIKLMVMHGGMSTTIEVVNASVPILGIPMFGDQPGNIEALVNRGAAISLDYFDLTHELLYSSIMKLTTDPSFSRNMKKVSAAFKDRPNTPLETAIYWIEYVLRHDGAPHLQSPAVHLSWYQLILLDVIFVIIVIVVLISIVLYLLAITIFNLFNNQIPKIKKA